MNLSECPACGAPDLIPQNQDVLRCGYCDERFTPNLRICPNCNQGNTVNAEVCIHCDEPFSVLSKLATRHQVIVSPIRMRQVRAQASELKKKEMLASDRRMEELQAIDRRREIAQEDARVSQEAKDRKTYKQLLVTTGVFLLIILTLSVIFLR